MAVARTGLAAWALRGVQAVVKVVVESDEWYVPCVLIEDIPPEATKLDELAVEATPEQVTRFKEAIQRFREAMGEMVDAALDIDPRG